jgi:hypothetical protein
MTPAPIATETEGSARGTRAILAASVGNLLEWYDFSVYALFAIYIAADFFPCRACFRPVCARPVYRSSIMQRSRFSVDLRRRS